MGTQALGNFGSVYARLEGIFLALHTFQIEDSLLYSILATKKLVITRVTPDKQTEKQRTESRALAVDSPLHHNYKTVY